MLLGAAVSIVETTRQYLKSTYGSQRSILPRSMSFCQFTFLTKLPVVLVVEDALQDERCAPANICIDKAFCDNTCFDYKHILSMGTGYWAHS